MPELFAHPFSSYCWKVLIALYENAIAFEYLLVDEQHPDNGQKLQSVSPAGKFPVLIDNGTAIFESSIIIEYLQSHYPGPLKLLPGDSTLALEVRMLDRFFDNYVMTPMQAIVADFIRPPELRDPTGVTQAKSMLQRSYSWLEGRLASRTFACGDQFSLADCAAAPALFYADWVCEIDSNHPALRAYRSTLLARPAVQRCVDDARPYRAFFPPGAPDRD